MSVSRILVFVTVICLITVKNVSLTSPRENLLLFVTFDGFRWDYLNRGVTPTFNDIASDGGMSKYIIGAYLSKTFPAYYTLVTGLHEESHGLLGNDMYDPILNDTFFLGNRDPKWWSQYGRVEPIWITNQHQGGSSAILAYPGMNVPFDGMLPNYEYQRYDPDIPFNDRSDLAVTLLANGSANFVALYFHEPDKVGHLSGIDSEEMDRTLKYCDDTLKYLKEKLVSAGLWDMVNLVVTSDHGMMPVDVNKTIFADQYLNATEFPYFTTENNPLLGIWPIDPAHTDALQDAMEEAPHVTVYKKEEIPPEYHYKNNIRVPPLVVAADPGWMIKGYYYSKNYRGNHGYNNSLPEMHPIFLAHGPSFKSGSVCEPFNSVDVYPLMCHLLGIKERPNNGTLKTVRALLNDPPNDHGSSLFIIGIAFAVFIGLLAAAAVAGMCLRRKFRQTDPNAVVTYHTVEKNTQG